MTISEAERLERWRLILGREAECEEGLAGGLAAASVGMDAVLEALY